MATIKNDMPDYPPRPLAEIYKDVTKAKPGSKQAIELHEELKYHGHSIDFLDRYPIHYWAITLAFSVSVAAIILFAIVR